MNINLYKMKQLNLIVLAIILVLSNNSWAKSDLDLIRQRVDSELMKPEVDDEEIGQLLQSIGEDGTWPGINYEDVSREGFEHRYHTANMVRLAQAYRSKTSAYFKRKKVLNAINLALKNWVEQDYFCDNWWHNQIGTPNSLVTLMLLVGDKLDNDLVAKAQPIIGRAHIDAPGARPGGDRIKIASIEAKNMLFLGNGERFDIIVKVIEKEIKYVDWVGAEYGYSFRRIDGGFRNRTAGGRGIQYDNSFHHRVDGVNNTLSYGLGYARAFIEWALYTNDTKYSFSEEKLNQLIDYYLDGICKSAVYGKFPDPGAKNRSISREGTLRPYTASDAEKLLMVSDYRKSELQEIADIRNRGIKPTTSHATYYWHSEHFSFQRPDFFTSVRMYSTRTHNMEQPYNSEGLLNHYRGDGTNHISRTGDEYYDIAPVFDFLKIPGATILQRSELLPPNQIQKLGLTDFVGAATDGKYAAVAFDFKSPHDPLIARKSWFFFDDQYVCLGAGISSKNRELPVATTLNQCLLRGDVMLSSEGGADILTNGESEYEDVDWVHHDEVSYIFPKPQTVNLKNSTQTGSWWTINKQSDSPKEEVSMEVFKLWIDHGIRPSYETYAYIVAPASTVDETKEMATSQPLSILANTPTIQAVMHKELEQVQIVCYKATEIKLKNDLLLDVHTPGILLLDFEGDILRKVTVSDPNRELGTFRFSISSKLNKESENIDASWNEQKGISEIDIVLPQGHYAGNSVCTNF